MKKKLLYISQCFPLPLDGGGRIKTFNTINTLAKKFDIYSVFISERNASKENLNTFNKKGIKVKVFQTNIMSDDIKKNYFKLIWNYIQFRPHFVYQYRYKPAFSYIKQLIKNWEPDVIHVDHVNSSQFLPSKLWFKRNIKNKPILILENHNINHLLFKTRLKETKKIIRKIYLFLEGNLNLIYGLVNYPKFDYVFSISDQEKNYLVKYCKSVYTQPLVYPLNKSPEKINKIYDILFIGYLQWPPNEIALNWFIKNILPLVNIKDPKAKLHVVGGLNTKLNNLKNNKNIKFHGYVKNLDKFLSSSKIFILPFKTGSGVRIKTLTALQNGIPIVSTSLGIGGLKLTNNKEYLHAETEQEFAKKIITLLSNKKIRAKMSLTQKKYFINNHGPEKNIEFLKTYQTICKTK